MLDNDTRKIIKIVFVVALLIVFFVFLYHISWVIELTLISILIVYILSPIAEYLKRRLKFSHFLAVAASFLLFLLSIIILISLIVPVVQNEIQGILKDLPHYIRQIHLIAEDLSEKLMDYELSAEFTELIPDLSSNLRSVLENVANISISVVGSIVDMFMIAFIVLFLLYDFQNIRNSILKFMPVKYKQYAIDIFQIIDQNFGGYIRGNILRCTIVGLATGIALSIAGMPYALLLGIIAGVLNVILYIGPYIAAVPAILISVSPHTPSTAVTIIIYLLVQAIDGTVLAPLLLGRFVKLKPITVIICLLIGGELAGFMGVLLSIPLAGIIKSLIEYFSEGEKNIQIND
ncbi:MAG: AI-2E family transporter [Firmicutes bacterium]|jgi:predicted PurR-regulated permease PerM|nr:AI-2E family transporter [Bacillota bacterium]